MAIKKGLKQYIYDPSLKRYVWKGYETKLFPQWESTPQSENHWLKVQRMYYKKYWSAALSGQVYMHWNPCNIGALFE